MRCIGPGAVRMPKRASPAIVGHRGFDSQKNCRYQPGAGTTKEILLDFLKKDAAPTRRKFLSGAAAATAGTAALGFPMVSRAQTTTLRFQSTWPTKDIFHEFAADFVKKVNDMGGNRLKIEL